MTGLHVNGVERVMKDSTKTTKGGKLEQCKAEINGAMKKNQGGWVRNLRKSTLAVVRADVAQLLLSSS